MTHPVKLDELLERFEFVPHEGSPHHWLCLTHGEVVFKWGDLSLGVSNFMSPPTREAWRCAYNEWVSTLP
jgi:hypothetical protein